MKKKKPLNAYVVRKTVLAESIEDALKREKRAPVSEVLLVNHTNGKYETVIGFGFGERQDTKEDGD